MTSGLALGHQFADEGSKHGGRFTKKKKSRRERRKVCFTEVLYATNTYATKCNSSTTYDLRYEAKTRGCTTTYARGDVMIGGAFSWDGRAAYLARWDGKNFHKLAVRLVEPYYDMFLCFIQHASCARTRGARPTPRDRI